MSKLNREGNDRRHGEQPRAAGAAVPEALALLVKLGAKNNNKCVSC